MLTGGLDDSSAKFLKSAILYPEGCNVPSMDGVRRDSVVSFLTQDVPPRIGVCGGYTTSCLVLQHGHWSEGILDNLPEERQDAATARIDAGVYILGGGTPSEDKTSFSSLFLRANSSSWVSGPELPVSMTYGPCAAPISAHSFLIVHEFDVREFDTRVAGLTSSAGFKEPGRWPQLSENVVLRDVLSSTTN